MTRKILWDQWEMITNFQLKLSLFGECCVLGAGHHCHCQRVSVHVSPLSFVFVWSVVPCHAGERTQSERVSDWGWQLQQTLRHGGYEESLTGGQE